MFEYALIKILNHCVYQLLVLSRKATSFGFIFLWTWFAWIRLRNILNCCIQQLLAQIFAPFHFHSVSIKDSNSLQEIKLVGCSFGLVFVYKRKLYKLVQRKQTRNQCIQIHFKLATPCFIFIDEEDHSSGLAIAQQGVHHLQTRFMIYNKYIQYIIYLYHK